MAKVATSPLARGAVHLLGLMNQVVVDDAIADSWGCHGSQRRSAGSTWDV